MGNAVSLVHLGFMKTDCHWPQERENDVLTHSEECCLMTAFWSTLAR